MAKGPKPIGFGIPISGELGGAPVIFADGVTAFGVRNSVVHVTLETMLYGMSPEGEGVRERVVAANLRLTLNAAHDLRGALDKALLTAASPAKADA